jgi:uncharacterized protein YegP (UPF0339 family)
VSEKSKFVLYRDLKDGYRWRLRSPDGDTLAESPSGHQEKSTCEAELRTAIADHHPGAEVLDATAARDIK